MKDFDFPDIVISDKAIRSFRSSQRRQPKGVQLFIRDLAILDGFGDAGRGHRDGFYALTQVLIRIEFYLRRRLPKRTPPSS